MITAATLTDTLTHLAVPDWLVADRHRALDGFLASGLPNSDQEAWKYTSLEYLERAALHPPAPDPDEILCRDVACFPGHVLAFQNGQQVCRGGYPPHQFAGALGHLADTLPVRQHLNRLAGDTSLANLNLACWQDGACLYVPAQQRLELPLFALYGVTEADAMLHPRTLAVLERGAEAVLVEHYLGQGRQHYWQNAVTEILLGVDARLTHIRVLEEGATATHTGLTAVRLERNSEYRALHLSMGGALARHDLRVMLAGPDSAIHIDAFDLADGRRHTDLHLQVDHDAPRTSSRISYRGMAQGRGRAIFNGHVRVDRNAHQTDAGQSCRGLLLSPHAEVDAMPWLEIYADDVKCGHAASVGNLDPNALFYLQSRGIAAVEARQLLLQGFANEALSLLDEVQLRDWLMPRLQLALSRQAGQEETA